MTLAPASVHKLIDENKEKKLDDFFTFLSIPSVSADSVASPQLVKAAEWLTDQAKRAGMEAEIHPTEGHPVVVASTQKRENQPTMLLYGHYDVQPADPLEEWNTPPFTPTVLEGSVYARGADDNKGQLFSILSAIKAWQASGEELPVHLVLVAEGEEEIGSPHFDSWLAKQENAMKVDCGVILDGTQYQRGIPALVYGLRGICYLEIEVHGPSHDLHSGIFGGVVVNPLHALSMLLSRLLTPEGRIAVPHFYDAVRDPEKWEREVLRKLPFDENELAHTLGVQHLTGEQGFTPNERLRFRPTVDVCGMWGGYAGPGAKTVIPSRAGAKISMRLVPDQKPDEIAHLTESYLTSLLPEGVEMKVTRMPGIKPVLVSPESSLFQAFSHSISTHFGRTPAIIRLGGGVGVCEAFQRRLNMKHLLITGWGNPEDRAHSPNERFPLEDLWRGVHTLADVFASYPHFFKEGIDNE